MRIPREIVPYFRAIIYRLQDNRRPQLEARLSSYSGLNFHPDTSHSQKRRCLENVSVSSFRLNFCLAPSLEYVVQINIKGSRNRVLGAYFGVLLT